MVTGRHDAQHNDIQYYGTHHKGIIWDFQHNNIQLNDIQVTTLSITTLFTITLNVVMLNAIMPSVIMPSVIMPSVIMPSVIMPSVIMPSVIMFTVVSPLTALYENVGLGRSKHSSLFIRKVSGAVSWRMS